MTTQELPVIEDPIRRKVSIGAGTAIKVGFFFALGVTLFTVIISLILGILAAVLGITLIPQLGRLF